MAESQSREVYFLNQVANQKYPKDFSANLVSLNRTVAQIGKYLIVSQQAIDDLNRDVVQIVQDLIEEMIIIFNGGDLLNLDFDWGDLKYVLQAVGSFFGFPIWGNSSTPWTPMEMVENFVTNFLSALLPGVNFDDLKNAMNNLYTGTDPSLVAIQNIFKLIKGNLTGLIDMARIPQLTLAQLTNQPGPNMLTGFGDFASEETLSSTDWTWDGTVGGGSAKAIANGTRKVLTTDEVAVSEGQALTISGLARHANLVGSGDKAKLVIVPFISGVAQSEVTIGAVTATGNNSAGQTISGAWTVPANVTGVRGRITVEPGASSGNVWWDNVSLRKTATSLPQQWINGLVTALSDLQTWIKTTIQNITGQARSTVLDAINDAIAFGNQLKTILGGNNPSTPLPNLTGSVISGNQTILGQVVDVFGGANITPVNPGVQGVKDYVTNMQNTVTNVTNNAVQAVVDGMHGLGSFAAAITQAIAQAIQDAINNIFGDGGTKWGQELYIAAGPVSLGFNDVPLGFGMPFSGKITDFQIYSNDHLSNGSGTKIVMEARKNGTAIQTMTWNGGNNTFSVSGLNLSVAKGDRITFYVTEASSAAANASVSVMGKYV